jgi:FtsH-binding integral membrane protein
MGLFFAVSILANKWAMSNTSKSIQYLGLGLYIVAMAIFSLPLLLLAELVGSAVSGSNLILNAAIITGAMVAGISAIAFTTKKDFSFLGGFVKISLFIAFGAIAISLIFGFTLGIVFSAVMVIVASASILYETSNIIHHYNTNQYVAASLGLFASVIMLFWYVLRILISLAYSNE